MLISRMIETIYFNEVVDIAEGEELLLQDESLTEGHTSDGEDIPIRQIHQFTVYLRQTRELVPLHEYNRDDLLEKICIVGYLSTHSDPDSGEEESDSDSSEVLSAQRRAGIQNDQLVELSSIIEYSAHAYDEDLGIFDP